MINNNKDQITKTIATTGRIINENLKLSIKYKGHELPTYFDIKDIDDFIPEEFFSLLPNKISNSTDMSLINVYKLLINASGDTMQHIPAVERSRILKRTYNVMLRYTNFYRFCYIIEQLLHIPLCFKLLAKLNESLLVFNIKGENLFQETTAFPTQIQTLNLIDKLSRDIIELITLYENDIITFIQNRKIKGLTDTLIKRNFKQQCLNQFLSSYKVPEPNKRWDDPAYLAYILTNEASLPKHFNPVELNQLNTYLNDFYTQLLLYYVSFNVVELCAITELQSSPEQLRSLITFPQINAIVNTTCITMNPLIFKEGKLISSTEFKNILLMLENVIRALSLLLVKTKFVSLIKLRIPY